MVNHFGNCFPSSINSSPNPTFSIQCFCVFFFVHILTYQSGVCVCCRCCLVKNGKFGCLIRHWLSTAYILLSRINSTIKSRLRYILRTYTEFVGSPFFFLLPDYLVFSSNAIAIGHRIWHDSFRMKKTYFKNRLRQIWLWSWFGFWIKIYLTNILRFCVIPVERTVFSSFEKTVTTARWQMIY